MLLDNEERDVDSDVEKKDQERRASTKKKDTRGVKIESPPKHIIAMGSC